MSGKSPFEQIKEFCVKEKKPKLLERILYHKYNEDINELIESYISENSGNSPSSEIISGFSTTLLSKNNLSTNVRLAEEEIDETLKDKTIKIEKKYSRTAFWKSVLSSALGSFLFILFLLLVFLVAENQIKSLFKIEKTATKTTEQAHPIEDKEK